MTRAGIIRAVTNLLTCVLVTVLLLAGTPGVTTAFQATPTADAPIPVEFPRDDGVHDSRIEWWYFTGHLFTDTGDRYGFEYVIFRAKPGDLEGYVSHFAMTDNVRGEFHYDQRILGSPGVAGDRAALDLDLDGWTMLGENGQFALDAAMPGYALQIDTATTKPAALHDGDGYIDYGNGTASYYYSWTRMEIAGQLTLDGVARPVTGGAWMDHQWGDFDTFEDGGWDWFAAQLEDGVDIMLYLIRDADGNALRVDGSIVDRDGTLTILGPDDFTLTATGDWTSPHTGTIYPSGWVIEIPDRALTMMVTPTMADQELDTRPTTGVVYWEGDADIAAMVDGTAVAGNAYVELTGYAPYEPLDLPDAVASPER